MIKYDIDAVDGTVGCYETQVAALRQEMNEIRQAFESMEGVAWEGEAYTSFMLRYEIVNFAHEIFAQRLEETGRILKHNTRQAEPVLNGINQLGNRGYGQRFGLDPATIQEAESTIQGIVNGSLPTVQSHISSAGSAVSSLRFASLNVNAAQQAGRTLNNELLSLLNGLVVNRQRTENWDTRYAHELESGLPTVRLHGTTWTSMGDLIHLAMQMEAINFSGLSEEAQQVKIALLMLQIEQLDDPDKQEALRLEIEGMLGVDWNKADAVDFDMPDLHALDLPPGTQDFLNSLIKDGMGGLANQLFKNGSLAITGVYAAYSLIKAIVEGTSLPDVAADLAFVTGTTYAGKHVGSIFGPKGAAAGGVLGNIYGSLVIWASNNSPPPPPPSAPQDIADR